MMRPIEIELPTWAMPGGDGLTIWPFIFYRKGKRHIGNLRAHEEYHWHHQLRWGVLPWLAVYLALVPLYGFGRRHPLERPAYEAQAAFLRCGAK